MPDSISTVPTSVYVSSGPAQNAALILASSPALADHVVVTNDGGSGVFIEHKADDAQRLWVLLLSVSGHAALQFSLYDVVAHLDNHNAQSVQHAVAALCRRDI